MSSGQPSLHSEHLSKQQKKKTSGGIETDRLTWLSPVSLMSQGVRSLEPAVATASLVQPQASRLQIYGGHGPWTKAWCAQSPRLHPQHHKLGVVRHACHCSRSQEDQEFKVSLSFVESSKPAWAT